MRIKHIVLLLLFTKIITAQDWVITNSDSLGFELKAPVELVKKYNKVLSDVGLLQVYSFGANLPLSKIKDHNELYQLMVIEYPYQTIDDSTKVFIVDGFIQESGIGGDIIYRDKLRHDETTWDYWLIHKGEYSIKSRMCVRENKAYVLQVISQKTKALNDDIEKFFDNFYFKETLVHPKN